MTYGRVDQIRFALFAGLGSAVLAAILTFALMTAGLNAYADGIVENIDAVFWKCGEEYGTCQASLLVQSQHALLLRWISERFSLLAAGFAGGFMLLFVPAVLLSIRNRTKTRG
jgi:hypothetical protein